MPGFIGSVRRGRITLAKTQRSQSDKCLNHKVILNAFFASLRLCERSIDVSGRALGDAILAA